jgi:hypothetical protein
MSDSIANLLARSDTIDVFQNPLVGLWMREKAKRDPVAFCRLAQANGDRLARLLGKAERVSWSQKHFVGWKIEELGAPFLILTGARGTVFLVNYPGGERAFAADRKMGSAITALLERLLLNLSGFGAAARG